MDAKFLQAYNEVILDNFNSVLKQNLMFQTQIRFHEDVAKELSELKTQLTQNSDSTVEINELKNKLELFKTQLSSKDSIIKSNSNNNIEKDRLQKAVNDQAKEISNFKDQIQRLQEEKVSIKKDVETEFSNNIIKLEEELSILKNKNESSDISTKKAKKNVVDIEKKDAEKEQKGLFNIPMTSSGGTF